MRRWFSLLLVPLFAWLFGVRGAWYSGDFTYRLQTDAFLRGTLALQPVPYGEHYDWAWGRGNQQVWGLGMPLLRLPFEAAARLFGAFGFPDALVFVFLYAAVVLLAARVFRRPLVEEWALLSVTMLCPAFINLCRTRFEPYEEAVGGAFLASLALGLLLLLFVEKPRARLLYAIAALAGFAPFIRATALAYGVVALALALAFGREVPQRARILSVAIFGLGLACFSPSICGASARPLSSATRSASPTTPTISSARSSAIPTRRSRSDAPSPSCSARSSSRTAATATTSIAPPSFRCNLRRCASANSTSQPSRPGWRRRSPAAGSCCCAAVSRQQRKPRRCFR
jgi:hypothetical protein